MIAVNLTQAALDTAAGYAPIVMVAVLFISAWIASWWTQERRDEL